LSGIAATQEQQRQLGTLHRRQRWSGVNGAPDVVLNPGCAFITPTVFDGLLESLIIGITFCCLGSTQEIGWYHIPVHGR
jgi:hypothetical protein